MKPGAVQCSQCKGTGVNSVDHFNGQFKAGGLCWLCRYLSNLSLSHIFSHSTDLLMASFSNVFFSLLLPSIHDVVLTSNLFCRGKKEMLCGECNGAGFLGGFMSTFDE